MADSAAPELQRMIAADHPDRLVAEPATMAASFLRLEPGTPLPIVVETANGQVIARFAHAGDAAIFASRDRRTLPAAIVRELLKHQAGQ